MATLKVAEITEMQSCPLEKGYQPMSTKRRRNKGRRPRQSGTAATEPNAERHQSGALSTAFRRLSYVVRSWVTPVPAGMVRYYCNCCGAFEDIPQTVMAPKAVSQEASRERSQMKEDWDRWVREHGVEGAKIVADCMD